MNLHMTPGVTVVGSFIALMGVITLVVFFPVWEDKTEPSDIWRPRTVIEEEGMEIYKANGCQYCHSMYVRAQDWDYGHNRVSQAGDYVADTPPLLGSERQGPDLSQEGGLRSDDWHYAHFVNPRFTRPDSIMPPYESLGEEKINKLIAYVQSMGYKDADARMERQRYWKEQALAAYRSGPLKNMDWLHSKVPQEWMDLPNPYPPDDASIQRGAKIYQRFCIGCHGPVGDGMGPAAKYMDPPPFNFTYLTNYTVPKLDANGEPVVDDTGELVMVPGNIGGMLYYQIMNGITGTTMPPFKTELESEKIWDVSNYVAVYFAGRDREISSSERSIPSSFEPPRSDELQKEEPDENNEEPGDN